jgi:hypothetical protein
VEIYSTVSSIRGFSHWKKIYLSVSGGSFYYLRVYIINIITIIPRPQQRHTHTHTHTRARLESRTCQSQKQMLPLFWNFFLTI